MWFAPYGTAIVVFRRPAGLHIVKLGRDGQEIFPNFSSAASKFEVTLRNSAFTLRSQTAGSYLATDASGREYSATVAEPQTFSIHDPWELNFPSGWGTPPEVRLDKLQSWTEMSDDGIRHFSGTAAYSTNFQLPQLQAGARVILNLGAVRETAQVTVNGREIGIVWKLPYSRDITSAAVAGNNTLVIKVTNLWPNRIIGDQSLPASQRFTHTNITRYTADSPLIPSGLLGPVQLEITTQVQMRASPRPR